LLLPPRAGGLTVRTPSSTAGRRALLPRVMLAAAATAVVLAAGAGLLVGRETSGGPPAVIPRAAALPGASVALPLPPPASAAGTHAVVADVPGGYAHTAAAALAAAVPFNRVLESDLLLHPDGFRAAVDEM